MSDEFRRPHFHYLFYDLSSQEIAYFVDAWKREFGFCTCDPIPILNPDGSPARVKVSKYVAKYLHKPKEDFPSLIQGLCEAPRRVSSKKFGVGVLPESLKSYYLCEDLNHLDSHDSAFLNEVQKRRKSLIIDGCKFPLPRRISEQYFRKPIKPLIREHVSEKTGEITMQTIRQTARTALSMEVSRFTRDRYLQGVVDKVRRYSESHSDKDVDRLYKEIIEDESTSLEDRAQRAREFYLQHLKKQKYG